MKKRVAVLMGGRSAEREISLLTGEQVYHALTQKGYEAIKVDFDEGVVQKLLAINPEVVFVALHGRFGEDGTIQGLLEVLSLPYTGSGVMASALGINKAMSKQIFQSVGINTPRFAIASASDFREDCDRFCERIIAATGIPLVVKPACEGSTIGMSVVKEEGELPAALDMAFSYDVDVVVEQFIEGVEITVGIIGNEPVALPTLEIVTKTDFYDYDTKYTKGLSEHIIPARIPEEQRIRAQEVAVLAHRAIGCRGFSRVDIIVDAQGQPRVLEINTIPGMTTLSLFPDAARAAGYEFPELISYIVELALEKDTRSL
ncbi:MAG TPA: D-alanine--D-alanine ligase [Anaerolineae bacterium]|nr:D-alanine--D-alanine ligase [Anaerolineae bacterium]